MVVVCCVGRRWGKTLAAMLLLCEEAGRTKGHYRAAYCTPTHRLARRRFTEMASAFRRAGLQVESNAQDLVLTVTGYGECKSITLFFWGLEEPDNLRGEGLHRAILDECKDIIGRAYYAVVAPMLADLNGKVLLIGTPSRLGKGSAWFRAEFLKARQGHAGYAYMHGPSEGNPMLTAEALDRLRRDCPDERTMREELDAEWLEDEGAVFTRLKEAFSVKARQESARLWVPAVETTPILSRETVYIGLDLGRRRDATLARAFRHSTRSELACLRLVQAPFQDQLRQIDAFYRRWPCNVVMVGDENGLGMQMAEVFGSVYGKGFVKRGWTAENKERDITAARMLCDGAQWTMLDLDWMKAEWEAYQITQQDSNGKWLNRPSYSAPPGLHDDSVTAGCLVAPFLIRPYVDSVPIEQPKPFTGGWHEAQIDAFHDGKIRRIS